MEPHHSGYEESKGLVVRVSIPEQNLQKCFMLNPSDTVGAAKEQILNRLAKDVADAVNYGLYVPPSNGRAGKFLEEERLLADYSLQHPVTMQFKFKSRDYRGKQPDDKHLQKLNSKANQKKFMDCVGSAHVDKIMKLLEKGFDPNFRHEDSGKTPLIAATLLDGQACKDTVMCLVNGGAHLDFRSRDGQTAMHHAVRNGNQLAIKVMLDLGASPNYRDCKGLTPTYYSALLGDNASCLEFLLSERGAVGLPDEKGWQEIHHVCKLGRVRHLEHLIFYGVDLDAQNATGNTALHICALNSQEESARVLLFRGAKKLVLNFAGQTAYEIAVIAGNEKMANIISSHSETDAVPFRQKPTYAARRRSSTSSPSPVTSNSFDISNLKAVSVVSSRDVVELGSEFPRNVYEPATTASSIYTGSSSTGGRIRDQPQASHLFHIVDDDSPSPPRARSATVSAATIPPTCRAPTNSHLPTSGNVTVQLCGDPYSSQPTRRGASLHSSPRQGHRSPVRLVNSTGSPQSSPKVMPKHGKKPAVSSPLSLPKVFTRLYPAVVGRKFIATASHIPKSLEELQLMEGDEVEVLFIGKAGMWEGRVGTRQGWFPSSAVKEMTSTGHVVVPTRRTSSSSEASESGSPILDKHIVVMMMGTKGLGFSIRGPKTVSPNLNFRPTVTTPSLQRIGDVDKGGIAEMAGLRGGDHILEVNGYSVSKASHSEVVKLIKSSGPELRLTVVSRSKVISSQHSPQQSIQHSPQQSPESSPDPRMKYLLSKQLSQSAAQFSNSSMAAILATPPRSRAASMGAGRNLPPAPPERKDSRLSGLVAGDLASETRTTLGQHDDGSPDFAGELARRAAQLKSRNQLLPRTDNSAVERRQPCSDGGISMIARLAVERQARMQAKAAAGEGGQESNTKNDKQPTGNDTPEMNEFQKALAARKAKLAAQDENNKDKTDGDSSLQATATTASPKYHGQTTSEAKLIAHEENSKDKLDRYSYTQATVTAANPNGSPVNNRGKLGRDSNHQPTAPPVFPKRSKSASNVHSQAASKGSNRDKPDRDSYPQATVPVPPASPKGSKGANNEMQIVRPIVRDDSGTRINALSDAASKRQMRQPQIRRVGEDGKQNASWQPEQAQFDLSAVLKASSTGTNKVSLGDSTVHQDSQTDSETIPVVGNETFDMDLDKILEMWGRDMTVTETPHPKQTETICLENDQNELVDGSSGWDDITLPPPDTSEMATNKHQKIHTGLRRISEEAVSFSSIAISSEMGDVAEEAEALLHIGDGLGSYLPPPEFIPGLDALEAGLHQLYPFPTPSPLLHDESDQLPPPPPLDIDNTEETLIELPAPEGFTAPHSLEDKISGRFEDVIPVPVRGELYLANLAMPPPPHLANTPGGLPPPFNGNQEEAGSNLHAEFQHGFENGDEPPPLPSPNKWVNQSLNETPPPPPGQEVASYSTQTPATSSNLETRLHVGPPNNLGGNSIKTEGQKHPAGQKDVSKATEQQGSKSKPLVEWTVNDVSNWLRSMSMDEYVQTFHDNQIQGVHLTEMTKEDFKELGVLPMGHRLTMANSVAKLQKYK